MLKESSESAVIFALFYPHSVNFTPELPMTSHRWGREPTSRRALGHLLFRVTAIRVLHTVGACCGLSEACRQWPDSIFPALQEVSAENSPHHISCHQRLGVNNTRPCLLLSDQYKLKGLGAFLLPRSWSLSASSSTSVFWAQEGLEGC